MAGVLGSLQQAVATLAQQREALAAEQAQRGAGAGTLLGSRRLHWLLLAAAGYGQSLLSKADVAALFLSRKILLVPEAGLGGVHEVRRRQGPCSC